MPRLRTIAASLAAMILLAFSTQAKSSSQIRLEDLRQTREHPLFSPTRRPPPKIDLSQAAAQAPPPPPIVPPTVTLVGVVLGANERAVIVQDKSSPKPVRVAVGGDIDGWRIDSITARSFILKNGDRAVTLTFPVK